MPFKALSVVLTCLPGLSLACPTASDLAGGIRFEIAGNEAETYIAHTPGFLRSAYFIEGDQVSAVTLARGLYVVEIVDVVADGPDVNSRVTYAFNRTSVDLPLPAPGGSFSTDVIGLDRTGFFSETHEYAFGAASDVSFGDCTYRMIPVEVTYLGDPDDAKDQVHWLPDLGLSYLKGSTYGETRDVYSYLTIEAMK